MEKEDDPRLIVTLEADGTIAERAWNRPHNQDRYVPASEVVVALSSRESTPAGDGLDQHGSQIRLTFDDKPKNLEEGFVFGSDPRICDVFLGERGAGFSGQQFRIAFNERGQVIFKNTSRKIAQVDYNGEDPPRRSQFTWILFNTYENIEITVGDKNNRLIFKVKWPKRETSRPEYEARRDAYLEECRNALPPLGQLGMESQQKTAGLTAQHSPKQQRIYLTQEELGCGGFGTVYKAVDVSTGDEYAAKKFHTGTWEKEVKILRSVSHERIVQFEDFSTEQGPLLVMEYLPLGSLACQRGITEEESLGILCQGLQALEYLHSQRLAHRDIKPENILLQTRTPFLIKLGDFGLAKNDSILETFCGSNAYAAPEIWEGRSYTAAVDIWSLGVIVLQYAYRLPKPTRKRKGSQWCRDIAKAANDGEDGDTLIDLISTKMLTMNYQDRLSASDCLEQASRLGFHKVHTFETGRATPTGKSARQHGVTRRTGSKSIRMQPLQNSPPDGDVSSGFYYVGGSSELTEIAPSKRDLRGGIQSYNRTPQRSLQHAQGATQIRNPQSEGISKSRLSKRQRQQTVQFPSDDARGRGQSKRSRASVSFEAGEDPSKPSNPRKSGQGSEQVKRSISTNRKGHDPAAQPPRQIPQLDPGKEALAEVVASFTQAVEPIPRVPRATRQVAQKSTEKRTRSSLKRASALAAEVGLREVETPLSKRNIHDNVRAILAGNLDGGNEGKAKVTDFDGRHVQIKIDDKIVLMRNEDGFLNASQILTLANKNPSDSEHLLQLMEQTIKVEVLPPVVGIASSCSWVHFEHGRILCKHLRLEQELQPLIDHRLKLQRDDYSRPIEHVNNYPTKELSQFFVTNVLPQPVTVRGSDFRIRVSDILKASRQSHRRVSDIRREFSGSFDKVFDYRYKGIYVDFWVGVELCRRYGLIQLEKELRTWKGVPQEPVKELRTWKGVPQEPVKEPELSEFTEITDFPNPVMVRMSDFRINATHIVKLAGRSRFTLMSLRNRLNSGNYDILRGTRKRDGTYVGFDIGIELCRKYGLVELEKRLYNLKPSSEGPVLDAEPSHTRAPSQTSRLLREPPDSNSVSPRNSSSEPMGIRDRDQLLATLRGDIIDEPIQAEDASEMDSGSDAAGSEASVISCKPLLERSAQLQAHKPIRRGKDSALSRHSSTDLPYSVWDSEPRYSQLSEVKPDLKPHSWETASPYPSFTDMY